MMWENLIIGFKIMGLGIGMVFSVLIILYITIKIMGKLIKKV
jgi:Na+-transporting methylmalonyl-CoA/oxaloacetate decarboxylase gamma subunit